MNDNLTFNQAIEFCNRYHKDTIIKDYLEALNTLHQYNDELPKEEYYKSSKIYKYYIIHPVKRLTYDKSLGWYFRERGFDVVGKKNGLDIIHFCSAFLEKSLTQIKEDIESQIKIDNQEGVTK